VFGGKYLNFLDFIFGSTGFEDKGRIRHVPTNKDLVQMAKQRMRRITRSIGNDLAGLSRTVSSVESDESDEDDWSVSVTSDDDDVL
jgi:hypothetical protein